MKKGKIIRFMLLALLVSVLTAPHALFGQPDSAVVDPTIPIPDGLTDLIDYKKWLGGLALVAGVTVFLTGLMTTHIWKGATKGVKQGISIALALILSIGSGLANIGYLADQEVVTMALWGLGSGFLANGWFTYEVVKGILRWVKLKPKPE